MPSRSWSMKDLRRELTLHLMHDRFLSYRHLTTCLFTAFTREPFPGSAECAWTWPSSSSSTRRWSNCSTTCGRRSRGTPKAAPAGAPSFFILALRRTLTRWRWHCYRRRVSFGTLPTRRLHFQNIQSRNTYYKPKVQIRNKKTKIGGTCLFSFLWLLLTCSVCCRVKVLYQNHKRVFPFTEYLYWAKNRYFWMLARAL